MDYSKIRAAARKAGGAMPELTEEIIALFEALVAPEKMPEQPKKPARRKPDAAA